MRLLRTVLIRFGTVAVLMVGLAHLAEAQVDNYFGFDYSDPQQDYYDRMDRTRERQERQRQYQEPYDLGLPPVHESDEYQSWDRLRGLEGCNALTNNPAAQAYCLEGLR